MRPVQIVLTDDLALKARLAIDNILADDNYVLTEEEEADYKRLAVAFGQVAANPSAFPVTGKMAPTIRRLTRAARRAASPGVAQPQSRRNKRKARQEKRQGYAKWRRRERRALVEQFNRARELYEAEAREAEALWAKEQERLDKQQKFNVIGPDGKILVAEVPAEKIVRLDGEPAFPKLVVVGDVP